MGTQTRTEGKMCEDAGMRGKDSCVHAKEGHWLCHFATHLYLRLVAAPTAGKYVLFFKLPLLWYLLSSAYQTDKI